MSSVSAVSLSGVSLCRDCQIILSVPSLVACSMFAFCGSREPPLSYVFAPDESFAGIRLDQIFSSLSDAKNALHAVQRELRLSQLESRTILGCTREQHLGMTILKHCGKEHLRLTEERIQARRRRREMEMSQNPSKPSFCKFWWARPLLGETSVRDCVHGHYFVPCLLRSGQVLLWSQDSCGLKPSSGDNSIQAESEFLPDQRPCTLRKSSFIHACGGMMCMKVNLSMHAIMLCFIRQAMSACRYLKSRKRRISEGESMRQQEAYFVHIDSRALISGQIQSACTSMISEYSCIIGWLGPHLDRAVLNFIHIVT